MDDFKTLEECQKGVDTAHSLILRAIIFLDSKDDELAKELLIGLYLSMTVATQLLIQPKQSTPKGKQP